MSFSLLKINYLKNGKNILSDISLNLSEKSIGILGHNGSGKTTLIKILAGIIQPTSGRVIFDQKNLKSISHLDRAKNIGYVQQDRENVIGFTLYEYVELGTFPHKNFLNFNKKVNPKLIYDALETVGLLNRKNELVENLSGGEMQILRIARVLAQKTRVILFDEPTSNLDLKNAHQVSSLIKKLNSQGIQTIVTSHDFRILKDISSFLCLLKDGVLVDFGQTKDVLTYENIINAFELLPEHYSKINSDELKDLPNLLE